MPIPDFIVRLREAVGTEPLWLSGVTAVVLKGDDVLLVKRSDTLSWTPVTGIIDPGEHPAVAARREVAEEADLDVVVERLTEVGVSDPVTYPNGDVAQYLDLAFRCRWLSGTPYPADGENVEARWFPSSELPPMSERFTARIATVLADEPSTRFEAGPR